jgi:hypothetical protein
MVVRILLVGLLAAAGIFAACGDDDSAPATTPPASAAASLTPPAATASPGTSPSPSATVTFSKKAGSFIYTMGAGEGIADVVRAFNGQRGTPPASFEAQLRALNPGVTWTVPMPGVEILVPLATTDAQSILPYASMVRYLGVGASAGNLELKEPSFEAIDAFQGQVALRRAVLSPQSGSAGYVTEYWRTDRRFFKGGDIDPDALVTEPAFLVAAGSMAATVTSSKPGDLYTFSESGVSYAVKTLAGAGAITPQQIAAALRNAPHD